MPKDLFEEHGIDLFERRPQNGGFLERAGNLAGKFNSIVEASRLPAFAGGLLQGAGDIGTSVGNLFARPLGHEIPHPHLSKYLPDDILTNGAFGAGQLTSEAIPFAKGASLIGKITGLGTKAGLGGKVAQGALSGALLGENEEGSRLENTILGGTIPIAGAAISKLNKFRSPVMAKNIIDAMKKTESEYKNLFSTVFKTAEERGYAGKYKPIKFNQNILKSGGKKDFLYALEQYNKKPSLEAAHEAQSQLGKYIADIGCRVSTLENHAIRDAIDGGKSFREHISDQLHRSGNSDLALDYLQARQGYKTDYVPYLKSKAIKEFLQNESTTKNFSREIGKEKSFHAKIGQHRHPEIQQKEMLRKILGSKAGQYAIGTALGGAGLYGLGKMFK